MFCIYLYLRAISIVSACNLNRVCNRYTGTLRRFKGYRVRQEYFIKTIPILSYKNSQYLSRTMRYRKVFRSNVTYSYRDNFCNWKGSDPRLFSQLGACSLFGMDQSLSWRAAQLFSNHFKLRLEDQKTRLRGQLQRIAPFLSRGPGRD